jgi:Flp pilus assembly protein TadD
MPLPVVLCHGNVRPLRPSPPVAVAGPIYVSFTYRVAFAFGVGLFGALLAAGLGHELAAKGRPPGLSIQPLAGGAEALASGNNRRAAREYKMATILTPAEYGTLLDAAVGLSRAGDLRGALAALDLAESLRGPLPSLDVARGNVLLRHHETEAALGAFSRALQKDEREAGALAGLGGIMLDRGRHADAIRLLRRSLEIRPADAEAETSLGLAYVLSGVPADAVEHFARAAALAPGPETSANLERARAAMAPGGRP